MVLPFVAALAFSQQSGQTPPTVQEPTDAGKLKTTYQLGESGSQLNFTLESAQLEWAFGGADYNYVAREHEKLLILNFTVQNPLTREQTIGPKSFRFISVSPDQENYEFRGYLLNGVTYKNMSSSVRPNQKVKCTIVLPIHAIGPVSQLIVSRGENTPELQYDLTGKIEPKSTSPFFKGDDLQNIFEAPGRFFDMGEFRVLLVSVQYSTAKIKGYAPEEGYKYLILRYSFRNNLKKPTTLNHAVFEPSLRITRNGRSTNNGDESWNHDILDNLSQETFYQEAEPGRDYVVQYYYKVPSDITSFTTGIRHTGSNRKVNRVPFVEPS